MSLLPLVLLSVALASVADERTELPPCRPDRTVPQPPGTVVRLFEIHKDRNPQNVLVVHTYADASCRLIGSLEHEKLLVDMYWRMDARSPNACYKPTHPRIKAETLEMLAVKSISPDRTRFTIDITPLDRLEHDLPTRVAEVELHRVGSGCQAETRLPLDPRDGGALHLFEINAQGQYVLGVPRMGVRTLELVGTDEDDRPVRRVYRSR
jgi:hypothetical protein